MSPMEIFDHQVKRCIAWSDLTFRHENQVRSTAQFKDSHIRPRIDRGACRSYA